MRKFLLLSMVLLVAFISVPSMSVAAQPYSLYYEGYKAGSNPVEKNGSFYIAAKSFATVSGYTFSYDTKKQTFTLQQNKSTKITFKLNEKFYYLNGVKNSISVPAITINNTTMITVNFIAKITGKSLKFFKEEHGISIGGYNPYELGNVKGVITWQWNEYIGTKPDVGASIALIPAVVPKKIKDTFFGLMGFEVIESQGRNGIYSSEADGNGNYNIDDVPAGSYYMLIKSANTNSDMTISEYDLSTLSNLFDTETMKQFKVSLKLKKFSLERIDIKKDKTVTRSHDFGYTYF